MNEKQKFSSAEKIILAIKNKTPLFLIDTAENITYPDGDFFRETLTRIFHLYDGEWKIVDVRSCMDDDDAWTQVYLLSSQMLGDTYTWGCLDSIIHDGWIISNDHVSKFQIDDRYIFPCEIEDKIKNLNNISNIEDVVALFN
jgi:hypothetical protein